MTILPLRLLAELEAAGFKLSVRDGKIHGPVGMLTEEAKEAVRENKEALIALISFQCPRCNQPLRGYEEDHFKSVQCPLDITHFYELMNKNFGEPMYLTTDGKKPERCQDCGGYNNGPYKWCDRCWLKIIEADEKESQGELF